MQTHGQLRPSSLPFPGRILCLILLLLACGHGLEAATVTLRLGTLAPHGTSYHKSLMLMGEKWKAAANGGVQLKVFPGGAQGSESDTVGLMQTGNLDAALLTAVGLADIEPAVTALQSMPMAFHSLEEVDYVGSKLRPMLEQRLLAKGYVVLFWSDSGWVRFFTKTAAVRPDEVRKLKMFSWAGSSTEFDLWKSSGFNPVSLETKAIGQALLSDTVSAVPLPPFFALAGQMDLQLKHMLELNWAPLVGALVIRKASWEKLPVETREAMLKVATDIGRQIKADGRAENETSVAAMVKRGLVVHPVPPEVDAEWRSAVGKVEGQIRGKIVPADMYDEVQRLLKEFKAQGGAAPK
ncbi:MAG TPA: C4-dicarboxylate ABC transporter substrate-binding protein [Verrucomicrobiales bacterium]|nr:C4-dicarboxylate ABC transporter substrate-binding protein [Verrucomicrobiales bacterium]